MQLEFIHASTRDEIWFRVRLGTAFAILGAGRSVIRGMVGENGLIYPPPRDPRIDDINSVDGSLASINWTHLDWMKIS